MCDEIEPERLHDALILVVDDVAVNRKVLAHSLNAHGYHNVILASDGDEALEITKTRKPDLVILDLMMPGMDGFTYCKLVREDKSFDNMPIIVQTALSEVEQKLKAFQAGANDYICKPVDPGELSARTKVHLSQKLLMADLRAYRKRIMEELEAARQMQNRLMPNDQQIGMCERLFDMKIAHHFETSSALGGDCWGMRPLSDQCLAVYMFDFSGRGITSAMNVFRMHTIMQELVPAGGEPGQFLTKVNRYLHPLLGRDELATMFFGIIDFEANCLLYSSAAAPSGLLFNTQDKKSLVLEGNGYPLGAVAGSVYETRYSPFAPGDLLVLYSDCINETRNDKGAFLSDEQLQETVLNAMGKSNNPATTAVEALNMRLRQHNPAPVFDDNTITAYCRNPKA